MKNKKDTQKKRALERSVKIFTGGLFHILVGIDKYMFLYQWKNSIWAATCDFQQCGMCDQQSLRSACAYAQSDQSFC